jgi:hypothetical protein
MTGIPQLHPECARAEAVNALEVPGEVAAVRDADLAHDLGDR